MRLKRFLLASALALSFTVSVAPTDARADPISAAVVAFVGFTGTAAAVATFVVNTALYAAGSFAISKVAKALGLNKQTAQERQANVTTLSLGEVPRELIVGVACTGGSLVDAFNFGGKYGTDTTTRCIALCDHLVDGLIGYYVDDVYYEWRGDGIQPGFDSALSIEFKNARADGWDAPLHVRQNGGWTLQDRMVGVTHVWVDTRFKDTVWTRGHPVFRFVVRGLRCYEPRKDAALGYSGPNPHVWSNPATHEFSSNPAVVRYNIQRGIYATGRHGQPEHLLFGRGLSAEEARPERVIAHANVCDEIVDGQRRYIVGGVISSAQPFNEIEQMFAAATAGVIVQREGGVEVEPGQAKAVVVTITDADLVDGTAREFDEFLPDTDGGRINTVIPRYIAPDQGWKDHAAAILREQADIIADGGPRETTLPLLLVTNANQANRVGEIMRRLARLEMRATLTLAPMLAAGRASAELEEGDWIAWQSDRYLNGGTVRFRIETFSVGQEWRNTVRLHQIAASVFGQMDPIPDRSDPPPPPVPIDALQLFGVRAESITLPGETSSMPAVRFKWDVETADTAMIAIRAEIRRAGEQGIAPSRTEDVAKGELVTTNGVGPDQLLECRLVPIGDPTRPVLMSNWITVSTAAIVAGDTTHLNGTPVEEITDRLVDVEALSAANAEAVGELEEVYGDTASAAASAASAAASEAASTQAAADAVIAKGAAQAAATGAAADAQAAAGSAAAATSAKTAAETARTQAQTAKTAAEAAQADAIAKAAAAAGSAATAAGSATTATQQANAAAGSASAAAASATAANTASGNASASASAAATSASNALGSQNAAATSATVAANASNAALLSASALWPERYDGQSYFTSTAAGDPATRALMGSNEVAEGFGPVRSITTGSNADFAHRMALPATPGRIYRVEAEFQRTNFTAPRGGQIRIGLRGMDANYEQLAATSAFVGGVQLNGDVQVASAMFADAATAAGKAGVTSWQTGAVWNRPHARLEVAGTGNTTVSVQFRRLKVTDVTEAYQAEQSASASATSAASAAASQTAAGQSASAAATSATQANTARGEAQTFRNEAATSATNAAGSATTAATQAGLAATARDAAAGSATAAGNSATAAQASATASGNSATASQTARLAAESARDAASGSAGAAATSATNAAASATASGNSASASQASRLAAESARDAASGSAQAAAGSASSAATASTAAGNSATAAAASSVTASTAAGSAALSAAALWPERYDGQSYFTSSNTGNPATVPLLASNINVEGFGPAFRRTVSGASGANYDFNHRMALPATPGRIYRVEVEVQRQDVTGTGTGIVRIALRALDASYASLGPVNAGQYALNGDVQVFSALFADAATAAGKTGVTSWGSAAIWLRPYTRLELNANTTSITIDVRRLKVTDVTEAYQAQASATAAATSASSAAASQTAAGQSATAATQAKLDAQTAQAAASNSATGAANSATSAAGSAATATQQATLAATARDAAAGSATAANTSAGNAAASATAAGNSAAASQASSVTATAAADNALLSAAALWPERYDGQSYFTSTVATGAANPPSTVNLIASNAVAEGFGPVRRVTISNTGDFGHRMVLPATPGRIYRVEVELHRTAVNGTGTGRLQVGMRGMDADYVQIATGRYAPALNLTGDVQVASAMFSDPATAAGKADVTAWEPGSVWNRPYARAASYNDNVSITVDWRRLKVTDVTEAYQAQASANAAATSASSAAASQTAAGQSASAAAASATAANTSAGNASTSATQASTSATNAAGSASTAATAATNAANSRDAAAGSASAAAGSASTANTKANEAGVSAAAAQASSVSATTAKNDAEAAKTAAETARGQAQSSATASATSASNAAASQTAAGQSASAAAGSATQASTSAGQASTFASQASTSAANASAASISAGVSASSAQAVANRVMPDRPAVAGDFFNGDAGGQRPENTAALSEGTIVAVAGQGDVRRFSSAVPVVSRGWKKIEPGHVYRFTAVSRVVTGRPVNVMRNGLIIYDANAAVVGLWFEFPNRPTNADGWVTDSRTVGADALINSYPGATYCRPCIHGSVDGSGANVSAVWDVSVLRVEDVTESASASASAAAAQTSAASAGGSAAAASISASLAAKSGVQNEWNNGDLSQGTYGFRPQWGAASGTVSIQQFNDFLYVQKNGGGIQDVGFTTMGSINMGGGPSPASAVSWDTPGAWKVSTGERIGIAFDAMDDGRSVGASPARWYVDVRLFNFDGGLIASVAGFGSVFDDGNWKRIGAVFNVSQGGYITVEAYLQSQGGPTSRAVLAARRFTFARMRSDATAIPEFSAPAGGGQMAEIAAGLKLTAEVAADAKEQIGQAVIEAIGSSGGGGVFQFLMRAVGETSVGRMVASGLEFCNVAGGQVVKVMELIAGDVFITGKLFLGLAKQITLDPTIPGLIFTPETGSAKMIYGAGFGASSDCIMWLGPKTTAIGDVTRTNGSWAFGTDGKVYYGTAELGGGGAFSASADFNGVTGSRSGPGAVQTNVVTITPINAKGAVTYQWFFLSGDALTIVSPTAAATRFSGTVAALQTKSAAFACKVTDTGSGATTTVIVRGIILDNTPT